MYIANVRYREANLYLGKMPQLSTLSLNKNHFTHLDKLVEVSCKILQPFLFDMKLRRLMYFPSISDTELFYPVNKLPQPGGKPSVPLCQD